MKQKLPKTTIKTQKIRKHDPKTDTGTLNESK